MKISDSYDSWASSYDSGRNSTRDLEAEVLRETFLNPHYGNILEMTYILSGTAENYNTSTGELKDGHFRYVIYIPYATTESTGLPDKPFAPGMPWLMDPGTHRAHIMITPPKQ